MKQKVAKYINLYGKSLIFVWQSCPWLCTLLLCTVPVQALLPSVTLWLTNRIINLVEYGFMEQVSMCLMLWCVFFILNNLMSPLLLFLQGQLTDRLTFYLNFQIMKKSESIQDISCFEDSEFYNKINLLGSEASWRPVNLLVFGNGIISNLITLVSMLVLLSAFHIWIALVLLVTMLVQGVISYRIQQQAFETLVANTEESRKLSYYSEVTLSAEYIKDVRLYNLYSFFQKKYKATYEQIRKTVQKNRIRQFAAAAVFLVIAGCFSALCFANVTDGVASQTFAIGAITVFNTAILYSVQSITMLVEYTSMLYDTLLYMENLFAYLSLETTESDKTAAVPRDFENLVFDNVTFSYPNSQQPALAHISFRVKKGEKIAIVGENGVGKSTLVKLLLRLYQNYDGTISMDGVPTSQMDVMQYRSRFAAVFQDFAQFDLTLRENVTLSAPCTEQTYQQALQKGGIDLEAWDVTSEHMLGKQFEDGRELSGGQWQRVALARAFCTDADILVLDEPTSALDARMERFVFDKFYELSKSKTVFFITHRLATVRQADKILVLKDGRISGFDTHEHLLENNPYYAELYHLQADLFDTDVTDTKKKPCV